MKKLMLIVLSLMVACQAWGQKFVFPSNTQEIRITWDHEGNANYHIFIDGLQEFQTRNLWQDVWNNQIPDSAEVYIIASNSAGMSPPSETITIVFRDEVGPEEAPYFANYEELKTWTHEGVALDRGEAIQLAGYNQQDPGRISKRLWFGENGSYRFTFNAWGGIMKFSVNGQNNDLLFTWDDYDVANLVIANIPKGWHIVDIGVDPSSEVWIKEFEKALVTEGAAPNAVKNIGVEVRR